MLRFNDASRRLVSVFFSYRNDIDIYTEDEFANKEFYKILFRRLVTNGIKINDVTPLGSKGNVLERCRVEPDSGRRKLFIVDGDINVIHKKGIPILKNLYVHDAYCIENFVFDKTSIVKFLYDFCADRSIEKIESDLRFDDWLGGYSDKLILLFIHFALVNYYGGLFKICNIQKYCNGNDLSMEKTDQAIEEARLQILTFTGEDEYLRKLDELIGQWENGFDTLVTIVSGKDYLLPMLQQKAKSIKSTGRIPSVQDLKFVLAQNCELDRLSRLKNTIENGDR